MLRCNARGIARSLSVLGSLSLLGAAAGPAGAQTTQPGAASPTSSAALREARTLLASRPAPLRAVSSRYRDRDDVFMKSTIALRNLETPGQAEATVPAFRGIGPDGRADVQYIITEASNYRVAKLMGINYAPRMDWGRGTSGSQEVTLRRGRIRFKGAVDFTPRRVLVRGSGASAFPPSVARPGAVGDAQWSSLVVLPSGTVINVAVVANATGTHDRLRSLDRRRGTATLDLLDGWQGGDRFYYHFVTDSSDPVAATIEQGVFTPRLGNLPAYGESNVLDPSALLGFSPNANGETGADHPERQGLNSTIVDGDRDPVNVFPLDPDNDRRDFNNYSPMWDAHVSKWTDAAIASGQRRAIRGFEDLEMLVAQGLVTSADANLGPANGFVAGLRASNLIINCPVIVQPFAQG